MSSFRAFGTVAALGRATTILMFGLIVLGSVVRSTGSGLACPDWPLCEGRIIPRLEFHVLIEWSHRTVALLVSLLLVATGFWVLAHGAVRRRLGALLGLAFGLLLAQILLGALTVWKLLHPSVVSSHLAVALLLFSVMLTLSLIAQACADEQAPATVRPEFAPPSPGLAAWLAALTLLTFAQAVLGGVVGSSHAGPACPDWPTCRGEWFPALTGLVGIHVLHRYGAYLLALGVLAVAFRARAAADPMVRSGSRLAVTLVLGQIALGVCNALLGSPPWISAMHLATAVTLLAVLVATTYRAASASEVTARWIPAEAR